MKNLFLRIGSEDFIEDYLILCVLDFYVIDKFQRQEYGKVKIN